MIMDQDEHHHAPLLALMILSLGDEYLQQPELENGATTRWIRENLAHEREITS
jgi:hypothetical protein